MASKQFSKQNVRVGGSGFTLLFFQGQPIGFAQEVAHQAASPVGPGAVPIHPLDEPYPVQVITPAAAGMGTITLNLYELYYSKVWERLGAESSNGLTSENTAGTGGLFANLNDIVDVFIAQARMKPDDLYVSKLIRPPTLAGETAEPYWETFHRCVITDIVDGENINVGTMEVIKQITIAYTRVSRNNAKSLAMDLRNRPIPAQPSGTVPN